MTTAARVPAIAMMVNDDPSQLEVLCRLGQEAGVEPRPFAGAEAALAAMESVAPPALIVTELHLPGIDGWRFCRLLRSPEYASFNGVPILVVSATFAGDHPERIAAEVGADAFLPWPVNEQAFVAQVQALLLGKEPRRRPVILIAEDDPDLAGLLADTFVAHGYRADRALTVDEAKAGLSINAYDLAVIDYHLPDVPGDVLLDAFRTQRPDCVCIMMTGDQKPALALDWMKRGAAAYLHKPFAPEFLVELCARARRERALLRAEDLLEGRTRELIQRNQRLESILEVTRAGTWEWNVQTGETIVNGRWAEIVGYTLAELSPVTSKTWRALAHPEDLVRSDELLKRHFAGELPYCECDCRMRHKDGHWVWVVNHSKVTSRTSEGKPLWVSGTHIDITEGKEAEEQLRESEERHRSLFMEMQEGFALHEIICDAGGRPCDYRYLEVNPAFERATGIQRERWIGHTVREVLPKVEDYWIQSFGEVALTGKASKFENYVRELDQHYEVVAYSPKRGRFAVIVLNVTERKRMEGALRANEERLRETARIARVGGWEIDLLGNTLAWTEEAFRIYELPADRAPNVRDAIEFYHPDDQPRVAAAVKRAVENGEGFDFEARLITAKKNLIWVRAVGAAVYREGKAAGMRGMVQDITDRKRAEEALREKSEELERYFATALDLFCIADTGGHFRRLNPQWERVLGYALAELEGGSFLDLVHPDDLAVTLTAMGELCSQKAVLNFQNRYRCKDGSYRWIEWRSHPGGDLIYAAARDITEHKRSEEALRASEEKFAKAFDTSPDAININRLSDGVYIETNHSFTSIMGYTKAEVLGKTSLELGVWKNPEDRQRLLKELKEKGQVANFEAEFRLKDGRVGTGLMSAVTIEIKGEPHILSITRDITARKAAEEELQRQEARYRTIVEHLNDAFYIHDFRGRITDLNENACRQTGYSREELLAGGLGLIDSAEEAAAMPERMACLLEKGTLLFEGTYRRKNGTLFWVSVSARVIAREGDGRVQSFVRDISELKRAEEEKEKLQAQLVQAQKMESVGRLAGGVAHDFNNMLQAILGNTALALVGLPPGSPVREFLQEIEKCAQRSADLTRQLLAFARKQTIAPKVLDLNETVAGMLKMLRRLIGEDIDLVWLPGADLGLIHVDPSQVDQVLANLCVNARDAIAGTGQVTIETGNVDFDEAFVAEHPEARAGRFVRLGVSDTGCGMSPVVKANLFEPFFTTKGMGQGTGLGLATVYGIVKQNHGFISVSSEPGQGTTFQIHLPRCAAQAVGFEGDASAPGPARGHETILLVEDEPAILKMCQRVLEQLGYRVLAAVTPGEAIQLAQEHAGEIHLLMTDVVMPETNGRDLARNFLSQYPNMKRLFMSGYTANVIAQHGVLEPGVHFLQKPFSVQALADKVREALGRE